MAGEKVLIGESDKKVQKQLRRYLEERGYVVYAYSDLHDIIDFLHEKEVDILLLSTNVSNGNGTIVLKSIRNNGIAVDVIMISDHENAEEIISAMKLGAFDYLIHPFPNARLSLAVKNCIERKRLIIENIELRKRADIQETIVGESQEIKTLKESIELVAKTNSRILVLGENGTGKELIARAIHRKSERAGGPFIEVNCAAIPPNLIENELFGHTKGAFTGAVNEQKGKFMRANGGTLFLDEIGDMTLETQAKVLHAIEDGTFQKVGSTNAIHVDTRIITATNKNLIEEMRAGRFREDLYYRLNVVTIHVPPLRARISDVPILVNHFFRYFCRKYSLPLKSLETEAIHSLMRYSWPGNVRELKNLIEKLIIMTSSQKISKDKLMSIWERKTKMPKMSEKVQISQELNRGLKEAKEEFERDLIQKILEKNDWNVAKSAKDLKIARTYLYKKIQIYNLAKI
ncbi:transcriptional regulatory protein ZraR [bacterium BMS3Abin05]|nr:transcriptional regulatory protein ZraR [bacterium BMS3Abin05]GBE28438.1 transcriptional regulatory protein ZraR [bacterium BMS3Bbin03]HDK35413.1 sigma-54-dependent Fis family transcriptional regulator [Bacteroidota bacterium]HDL78258.1 sigma-54-dependent Fis family transcriptional regulator [Bacteroidota bacterium]HDZ11590.1 sigma-54-dependent Fis family transcriptional regulator [Bacteroidota bacterium]